MDNLTHSLFGFSIAEASLSFLPNSSKKFRRTVVLSSVLANNLPDLDFCYAPLTRGKLGYLIHHRGHTHTILMAMVFSAVWILVDRRIQIRKRQRRTSKEQWCLGGVILLGFLVHIGLDSLNSYGVRPFWPFDDRWHYGDAVFIIEPWIWVALLPEIIFSEFSPVVRGFGTALLVFAVGFCWWGNFVPWEMATVVSLTALALCGVWAKFRCRMGTRAFGSLGSAVVIIVLFLGVSQIARARFRQANEAAFPKETLRYLSVSPLPANPFCWNIFALTTDTENVEVSYVVRRALLSPFPNIVSEDRCFHRGLEASMPKSEASHGDFRNIEWVGEWKEPLARLKKYRDSNCEFAAFLKFARFPFIEEENGQLFARDLRHGSGRRTSFAEMALDDPPQECPQWLPPWVPPTESLWDEKNEINPQNH